jgi:ABC-2 type transport system permease protein
MTVTSRPAGAATPSVPTIGYANLARSEWTKLTTVRSTYWTALGAVLAAVALGALICARMAALINSGHEHIGDFDPTTFSLNGLYLAQIAAGALGVLVISSEYGTGMIRATLTAVPQRRAVLGSKAMVFGLATLAAGELMSFSAFAIGQALLSRAQAGVSLADPGVARAVVGGGLYLTAVGLLGFGLGALIRHTAGALSAFFGVLFAPSVIVDLLPSSWHAAINYMPANAGSQIFTVEHTSGALAPWAGLGVLVAYAAAVITAATLIITHRDT